jgi:hypothetical protein
LFQFEQNEGLRTYLFKTSGSRLVYANPWDRFWGVGLEKIDPKTRNPREWPGENRLGDLLMEVRTNLMATPKYQDQLEKISKEKRKSPKNEEPATKKIRVTP